MPSAARSFRIFLSSTFEDLKAERDALQRRAFVNLRVRCEEQGARFQPVDLRWGVREEAGLDQRTMEICLREIARCQQTRIKPNFLVLLGQRYGWRPLPSRIPAPEFAQVIACVPPGGDRSLLQDWYRRDDNAVPPEYLLEPRAGVWTDDHRWRSIEPTLHRLLLGGARAARLPADAMVKYQASATHQEILQGLGTTEEDRRHVFVFCRDVTAEDCDPDLVRLRDSLRQLLPAGNVRSYAPGELDALSDAVETTLGEVMAAEIARLRSEPPLQQEIEAHDAFARERSALFGRREVLDGIGAYLRGGSDLPLVVQGPGGSGKSAVLARASEEARAEDPDAVVVRRFIGASPGSAHGLSLLRGLCEEIGAAYGSTRELPVEYDGLARACRECLALATPQHRLLLFADALDQLPADDPARSLSWLAGSLPAGCRVVLSTTAPTPQLGRAPRLEMGPLAASDGARALDDWLAAAGRSLQEPQRTAVLDAFGRSGLPLYLKLAFEEARHWRSDRPLERCQLGAGVEQLIASLLDRLSSQSEHGPVLVSRSLAYLAAARHGLAEDELLDVLSADPEVLADFIARSPTEQAKREAEQLTTLPLVIWSRLFHDLQPYFSERQADDVLVLGYRQRQLREVAATRAASEMPARHLRLAAVFEHACHGGDGRYRPARRAIGEMAYHYRIARDLGKLKSLYSDLSFLCGFIASRAAFELREEAGALPPECIDEEVSSLLKDAAAALTAFPLQAPQLFYKELRSEGYRRQAAALASRPWIRLERVPLVAQGPGETPAMVPLVTRHVPIQAWCVASGRKLAFLHTAADRIEAVSILDLRPRGEIRVEPRPGRTIKALLCDAAGGLLALVQDTGVIEVLRTQFSDSGDLLATTPAHEGTCLTGRFGAVAACALGDAVVYQTPDRALVRVTLDEAGAVQCRTSPPQARTLTSCVAADVACLTWRSGSAYALTFAETDAELALEQRPLAVSRFGRGVAVSTDDGRLRLLALPGLELQKTTSWRLPILSMSPGEDGTLLLTDRHGNILTMDAQMRLTDHGRCTQDVYDDHPSGVYAGGDGAFYVSQRRCVALRLGGGGERDIQVVAGSAEHPDLLRYTRAGGYRLQIGDGAARTLAQNVVGETYEFEFTKFRAAWCRAGVVAYTASANEVTVDDGRQRRSHALEADVVAIVYHEEVDAFLVLTASGRLHVLGRQGHAAAVVQMPRSENGLYLIEACGPYACVAAFNVRVCSAFSSAFSETVLGLYRLERTGDVVAAAPVDVQHVANDQPRILALAYDAAGNALYQLRADSVQRWRLGAPALHEAEQVPFEDARDPALRVCAGSRGLFYADIAGGLNHLSLDGDRARVPGYRTVTYLSPSMQPAGYMVEDNAYLYRFTLEE